MKTLNTNEIITLSIKVTEEIEEKSLHNFLRTSILNSNLFFSKNTYYYFYYNLNTFTYEIIFYEKLKEHIYLEPFLIVQNQAQNDDVIKVFFYNNNFIVSKNEKILILKKVNKIDIEEISLYVKQIYKIKEFEIIEILQEYLDALVIKKNLPVVNAFHPLYPPKSFYIFCTFLSTSLLAFVLILYFIYYKEDNVKTIKHTQQIVNNFSSDKIIDKTIELFKYIKLDHIIIDKVSYTNSKIKTILYHKKKSHLLSFTNRYTKNLHIKQLKYNDIRSMYSMEITVEY